MRIIRGKYGRRRFDVPKNITARPTTDFARENIFNVIENMIDLGDGVTALDLFAGTGAITWELASRGCTRVTAVEQAPVQCRFISEVKSKLGDEAVTLVRGDVFKFVRTVKTPYDIVFADPPYDHPQFESVPQLVLSSGAVKPGTLFVLEHSSKRDFSGLPGFVERRVYGSVNFSIFCVPSM